jgi:ABC-type sugar transport system substrate-binding protein
LAGCLSCSSPLAGKAALQHDPEGEKAARDLLEEGVHLLSKGIDILALPRREFEASASALAAAKDKGVPVFLVAAAPRARRERTT